MKDKHKKFILDELIPEIMREGGRGFNMEYWNEHLPSGKVVRLDGVRRKVPSCGTVGCIGGLAERLLADKGILGSEYRNLGLNAPRACSLFYGWRRLRDDPNKWPKEFASAYRKCKTAFGKAKVAVRLLKRVVETDGKVLD